MRPDNSSGIVGSANLVKNTVNVFTGVGFQNDLELEGFLSTVTKKLSPQLKEQWLQLLQDHRLLAANLIVYRDWLESTAFIHKDLLT